MKEMKNGDDNTMIKTILRIIEGTAILGLVAGFIILDYLFGGN